MLGQVTANALIVGCSAALLALALSLVRKSVGFFDFSLAGIYTIAAYVTHAGLGCGMPMPAALLVALLTAVSIAMLLHVILYELLRRLGATPEVLLIVSLSVLLIIQNVLPLLFGDGILSLPVLSPAGEAISLWGVRITKIEFAIVGAAAAAASALLAVFRYTDLGLQVRAIAQDRQLSRIYGVRPERVLMATVLIAASLAGTIGILSGFDTDLTPTMGFRAVLLAAVAAVIGGGGSVAGVVIGAITVAGAQQVAAFALPVQWQDTIVFSCLIIFVVIRPEGVFGRKAQSV